MECVLYRGLPIHYEQAKHYITNYRKPVNFGDCSGAMHFAKGFTEKIIENRADGGITRASPGLFSGEPESIRGRLSAPNARFLICTSCCGQISVGRAVTSSPLRLLSVEAQSFVICPPLHYTCNVIAQSEWTVLSLRAAAGGEAISKHKLWIASGALRPRNDRKESVHKGRLVITFATHQLLRHKVQRTCTGRMRAGRPRTKHACANVCPVLHS